MSKKTCLLYLFLHQSRKPSPRISKQMQLRVDANAKAITLRFLCSPERCESEEAVQAIYVSDKSNIIAKDIFEQIM